MPSPSESSEAPDCVIHAQWRDTTVLLSCSGVIDMVTAPLLEDAFASAAAKAPSAVIVDLSAVNFLASTG